MEVWKVISGYDGYEISSLGRIRHAKTGRIRKTRVDEAGREIITLLHKRCYVHRLVMLTFNPIEEAHKFDVDHIDWDQLNNKLSNLRWASRTENLDHKRRRYRSYRLFEQLLLKYGDDEMCKRLEGIP